MSDYFDRLTSQADDQRGLDEPQQTSEAMDHVDQQTPLTEASHYTAGNVKATAQELLKYGLLEADRKPNLYQVATTQTAAINQILEPFDLRLKVDDVRGLAFLVVSDRLFIGNSPCWWPYCASTLSPTTSLSFALSSPTWRTRKICRTCSTISDKWPASPPRKTLTERMYEPAPDRPLCR
jgi:hypothetical protein